MEGAHGDDDPRRHQPHVGDHGEYPQSDGSGLQGKSGDHGEAGPDGEGE